MENKQAICTELVKALQLTRQFFDVTDLIYKKHGSEETVTMVFSSGYTKTANVAADSGYAMILDIINQCK